MEKITEVMNTIETWMSDNSSKIPFSHTCDIEKDGDVEGITITYKSPNSPRVLFENWLDSFISEVEIDDINLYLENFLKTCTEEFG
jgi:hypothetical protein